MTAGEDQPEAIIFHRAYLSLLIAFVHAQLR
jgi:hypothetical protein